MLTAQRNISAVAQRRQLSVAQPAPAVLPKTRNVVACANLGDALKSGAGVALAAAMLLTSVPQPALAENTLENLESLKGRPTPPAAGGDPTGTDSLGQQVLDEIPKVDDALRRQPTPAVQQAADEVKQVVVDNAKNFADQTQDGAAAAYRAAAQAPDVTEKQAPGVIEDRAQGLSANLAQLKSILDGPAKPAKEQKEQK